MDQEPPSKRRRTDDQYVEDWFDVVDDDDLVLQSFGQGLDAKDEGYRLSIERAYSDVRFQSTMAHIFEKYGRDFDGIGDEIDLMTGEIIVDNGHIHNMRNEIDVGDDFLFDQRQQQHQMTLQLQQSQLQLQSQFQQQQRQQEEEDAMLWKEFTHTDEDDDEDEPTPQDKDDSPPAHDDDSDERAHDNHKHHDRTHQNGQIPSQSMALVPRAGVEPPGAYWAHQPPLPLPPAIMPGAFWPGPFGISPYAFGAPPMALAPSPYTMISPPFAAAAPWNMPLPLRGPQWTLPPAQMPRRDLTGHRYNFKAQKGTSSIWAVRSRYKEAEDEPLRSVFNMALDKHLSQSGPRAMKGLPAPPDRRRLTYHDDDDGGVASLGTAKRKRGRPRKHFPEGKTPLFNEEDRVSQGGRRSGSRRSGIFQSASAGADPEDAHSATKLARKRGRPRKPKPVRGSPARERDSDDECSDDGTEHDSAENTFHADPHIQHDPAQARDSLPAHRTRSRRCSTRVGKQVGSTSEPQLIEYAQEPGCQVFRIEIPALDARSWEEYRAVEMVDASEGEPDPSDERPEAVAPNPEPNTSLDAIPERFCLDDDQDTAQSSSNEPSCPDSTGDDASEVTAATEPDKSSTIESPKAVDSACAFSDDEAPIILSNVKVPKRGGKAKTSKNSGRQDEDPAVRSRPDSPEAPVKEVHRDAEQDPHMPPAADDSGQLESVAHASHDLPGPDDTAPASQEGRQDNDSDAADIASDPEPQETRHDTGADTSKSSSAPPPPEYPSDAVLPLSSSPTRSLTRFTARVSLNDQTPRLGRETRWLRKNAASFQIPSHESPSSPASEDALPRRRRRSMSRKLLSIAEQQQQEEDEESPEPAPEPEHHPAPSVPDRAHVSFADAPPPPAAPCLHDTAPAHPGSKTPKTPGRRSILSLAPAHSDADADIDIDELGRSFAALPFPAAHMPTAGPTPRSTTARKRWKSSARTTEVYRTPVRVRARPGAPVSPDSVVMTPGGTLRVCGMDGYRCGRDFCFTCL